MMVERLALWIGGLALLTGCTMGAYDVAERAHAESDGLGVESELLLEPSMGITALTAATSSPAGQTAGETTYLTIQGEGLHRSFAPEEPSPPPDVTGSGEQGPGGDAAGGAPGQSEKKPVKRLLVYTARFDLLVANVSDSISRFLKSVEDLGGYLEKRENASITVRIPATEFRKLTDDLRAYGLVVGESIKAEDVTRKYFDLRIRIENAEKARERLIGLLEKAESVEVTLKIEAELRRLSEEIERMRGELKYLSESIAYSTVEVVFRSNAPPPRVIQVQKRSRYPWVNELGVEHVLTRF